MQGLVGSPILLGGPNVTCEYFCAATYVTNCTIAEQSGVAQMLGVLAKPFTGLQMTQLAGELQRLFALCSELRFRSRICVSYFVSLPGRVDPAV